MRRRAERIDDDLDEVVHRRFVRVIGLPADVAPGETSAAEPASAQPPASVGGSRTSEPVLDSVPGTDVPAAPDHPVRDGTPAARALAAFDPGRRGVRALAAVALAVVAVAGFLSWHSRPRAEPIQPRVELAVSAAGSPAATVVIAVAGRVQRPGLVRLPAGARVADAIEAAGGLSAGTDPSYVNLARRVVDGELLLVGVTPPPGLAGAGGAGAGGAGTAGTGGGPAVGGPGGPLNLNSATLTELQTLPGVGPVLAQRILDYRTQHGGFRSVNDLRQVDGIGDARFKQLKDLVAV